MEAVYLLTALLVKHFICDYPLQMFPLMYENKGTFPHPGGIVHALIHSIGTCVALYFFSGKDLAWNQYFLLAFLFEGSLHYVIDYWKVNIGRRYKLGPTTSSLYWVILGFDQLLHHLTYVAIVFAIFYQIR
jgi:hypothetical protein